MALTPGPETVMTAPLKAIDGNADLPALMTELAAHARAAARVLALASPEQ
jgi:glutamate-5-semialdehyde dehydrogenase